MSDTPRTDALIALCGAEMIGNVRRLSDHARLLERELQQAREFAAGWHNAVDVAATILELPHGAPSPAEFLEDIQGYASATASLGAAVDKLLPEDWRDGVMDHMPGVAAGRIALDKMQSLRGKRQVRTGVDE